MKAPHFWQEKNLAARLLKPLGEIYGGVVQKRLAQQAEYRSKLPVLCVGNIVLGGSGKTPVVQALTKILLEQNKHPAILLRGYKGKQRTPLWVTPETSTVQGGDEALLHARIAPTLISADRVAGARAIEQNPEITHIVMDDGLQNPSLHKTCSVLVVDGPNPFGNGLIFPAGPLRETIDTAIRRVQALVILGEDRQNLNTRYQFLLPIFQGELQPLNGAQFKGKPVVAFAGIGNPDKFFRTLGQCDAVIAEQHVFADHHPYQPRDLAVLAARARMIGASLVTTRKDWVRLPPDLQAQVQVLEVQLVWQDAQAVFDFMRHSFT